MSWPSVTEVIRHQVKDSYPWDPTEYYLRRGRFLGGGKDDATGESFVGACDLLAAGEQLDAATIAAANRLRRMPLSGNNESWGDYIEGFKLFLADTYLGYRNVPILNGLAYPAGLEVRIESERVVGHPDQIWRLYSGECEGVIDLKCGTAPKWTAIQTAFYDLGVPIDRRRRRFALELRPGKYKLIEYDNPRDYDVARIWARAFWWAKEFGG